MCCWQFKSALGASLTLIDSRPRVCCFLYTLLLRSPPFPPPRVLVCVSVISFNGNQNATRSCFHYIIYYYYYIKKYIHCGGIQTLCALRIPVQKSASLLVSTHAFKLRVRVPSIRATLFLNNLTSAIKKIEAYLLLQWIYSPLYQRERNFRVSHGGYFGGIIKSS